MHEKKGILFGKDQSREPSSANLWKKKEKSVYFT